MVEGENWLPRVVLHFESDLRYKDIPEILQSHSAVVSPSLWGEAWVGLGDGIHTKDYGWGKMLKLETWVFRNFLLFLQLFYAFNTSFKWTVKEGRYLKSNFNIKKHFVVYWRLSSPVGWGGQGAAQKATETWVHHSGFCAYSTGVECVLSNPVEKQRGSPSSWHLGLTLSYACASVVRDLPRHAKL